MNIINYLKMCKKKIVLYGAGAGGKLIFDILELCDVHPAFFVDNDIKKNNVAVYKDVRAFLPENILDKNNCIVINCVNWFSSEIIDKKIKEDGFSNIFLLQDLLDYLFLNDLNLVMKVLEKLWESPEMDIMYTVKKKNKVIYNDNPIDVKNDKIAVYTSIFGNYDKICFPTFFPENVDYYYISENNVVDNKKISWIDAKLFLPPTVDTDIKKNRYFKMHPHLIFPEYRYSVYIDGNLEVVGDVSNFIKESKTSISVYEHFNRDCLYYESMQVVNFKRVCMDDVYNQISRYLSEGMPLHYGLAEMAVIAREHNNPICKEIMELWWHEFDYGAQRDQLSFMYSLWKLGYSFDDIAIIDKNFRNSKYLVYHKHIIDSKMIKN